MAKKKAMSTIYPVDDYLTMLRLAKRSEQTIEGYRKVLKSYAGFLGVPLDKIHDHLSVTNLLRYAGSRQGKSEGGTKTNLSILHRYFVLNGVAFDELQYNAVRHKAVKEHNDKPLETATLQKMMDLTDVHGRAILSFLVSTGCRAGETCKVLLSDVHGDVVTIRPEIAKGRRGGKVYLTAEAREYLDLWLKERDEYIRLADKRTVPLVKCGGMNPRPVKDERLFCCAYTSMHRKFSRLYQKVDGEQGKYHSACTIHSCRKFFRTHAAYSMHQDLVTGLMRQTGYLDSTYVRMSDDERRRQFHKNESVLYITRVDHRETAREIAVLKQDHEILAETQRRLALLELHFREQTGR